jgi:hypothetical protein
MLKRALAISFVLVVGCGSKAATPQGPGNTVEQAGGGGGGDEAGLPPNVSDGALWTCAIEDYDPQPCKFHKESDGWHLTKVMGSQRFTATVAFTAEGMKLVGEFFCPWGDCTEPVDTTLTADGAAYGGNVAESPFRMWWDEGVAGEYGGAGYGKLTGREVE